MIHSNLMQVGAYVYPASGMHRPVVEGFKARGYVVILCAGHARLMMPRRGNT